MFCLGIITPGLNIGFGLMASKSYLPSIDITNKLQKFFDKRLKRYGEENE